MTDRNSSELPFVNRVSPVEITDQVSSSLADKDVDSQVRSIENETLKKKEDTNFQSAEKNNLMNPNKGNLIEKFVKFGKFIKIISKFSKRNHDDAGDHHVHLTTDPMVRHGHSFVVGMMSTQTTKRQSSGKRSVQLVEPEDSSDHQSGIKKCWKIFCPCFTREIPAKTSNYVVKLNEDKRTENKLEFIVDCYQRLVKHHIEMDKTGTEKKMILLHLRLVQTFQHCRNAIHFLQRVNLFCGDVIKSLSYYFEENLSSDQLKLVEGRSVVGSYMWVILMCMKSIRSTSDYSSEDFDETKRTLEDVVGLSYLIWKGVKHIGDAFIQCRKKTEQSIIVKYIPLFDPTLNLQRYLKVEIPSMRLMNTKERKLLIKQKKQEIRVAQMNLIMERKIRIDQLKRHNKVGGNDELLALMIDQNPIPPPPAVRVTKKLLVGVHKDESSASRVKSTKSNTGAHGNDSIWTPFDGFRPPDRLATLNALCKRVVQIYEEVYGYLRSLDKYLHVQNQLDDTINFETSYYEAICFMSNCLAYVTTKRHLLQSEDCEAIVEMGMILDDELDMTEFLIMTLRKLAHESRHTIHVSYEFARLCQRCNLPPYELISPPEIRHCRGLEILGVKETLEDIEYRKIEYRQAVAEFNTSPYIEILTVFPVKGKNYQLKVEPIVNIPKLDGVIDHSNYTMSPSVLTTVKTKAKPSVTKKQSFKLSFKNWKQMTRKKIIKRPNSVSKTIRYDFT